MSPRVVFVGDLGTHLYLSGEARAEGLRRLGLEVIPFDTLSWLGSRPMARRLNGRLFLGKNVRSLNRRLLETVEQERPDVVWVDSALWIYPRTLKALRGLAGVLVYWMSDEVLAFSSQKWLHRRTLPLYDLYLTTQRLNVLELRERYGVFTVRAGMGYDPVMVEDANGSGPNGRAPHIVFAGHWEPATEDLVSALRGSELPLAVFGPNWAKARDPALRAASFLPRPTYAEVIKQARLALGILSAWGRNESTPRSFEIPAIGTALLAQRTAEHEYVYREGREALFFSDARELVATAQKVFHDTERLDALAVAGRERCFSLGLSWHDHMAREWPIVARMLEGDRALRADDDHPFWSGFRKGEPFARGGDA